MVAFCCHDKCDQRLWFSLASLGLLLALNAASQTITTCSFHLDFSCQMVINGLQPTHTNTVLPSTRTQNAHLKLLHYGLEAKEHNTTAILAPLGLLLRSHHVNKNIEERFASGLSSRDIRLNGVSFLYSWNTTSYTPFWCIRSQFDRRI